jgi:hypothetical protein
VPIGIFTYDALQDQIFRQDGNRNRPSQGSGTCAAVLHVLCVPVAGMSACPTSCVEVVLHFVRYLIGIF